MADVASGLYTQGPGGYYKLTDRSGPYAINTAGVATLLCVGGGLPDPSPAGAGGYNQGLGGYYKESDRSGPYCLDSSGVATLMAGP